MFKTFESPFRTMGFLLQLCVFAAVGFSSGNAVGQDSIIWKEKLYNPQPLGDDLILPMPCGGAMVFRPVEIPSAGMLDDRPVELGQADPDRAYKEGRRISYIAGTFTDPNEKKMRLYYLAKYETTRDQYTAVMEETCPGPSMRGRLPVVDVSWFDAVDFTKRYTEWLLQHAQDKLPTEDREAGFIRLPTEVEWEFAARGGSLVDAAERVAAVFPMPEGDLIDYAWYSSTQSAGGKLKPAGLLKPNPIGLYDILGNAAEMVLVPFHLDHRGRLHGQAGGFVIRGGDIDTPPSQMRTAARQEHNYFDPLSGQAKFMDTVGFRLLLTAPVIVSEARRREILRDWSVLPSLIGDVGNDADKALKELHDVAVQTRDGALRAKLELIRSNVEKVHTEINDARKRTLRFLIRTGAFLAKRVSTEHVRVSGIKKIMDLAVSKYDRLRSRAKDRPVETDIVIKAKAQLDSKLEKWNESLLAVENAFENSLSYYSESVVDVARDYGDQEMLGRQLEVVDVELDHKESKWLIPYAQLFVRHVSQRRDQGDADKAAWLQDILSVERR